MEYENIITWEDLKEYAETNYPEANQILKEAHKEAEIISSIMYKFTSRKNFKYNSAAKSRKMRRSSRLQRI